MKRIYPLAFCLLFFSCFMQQGKSQEQNNFFPWELKINAGYNIGGTSPMPFPQEVREIKRYTPAAFAPHIAFEATRWFDKKWGLTAQFAFDLKGFKAEDQVQYLHTEMEIGKGSETGVFEGSFSGENTTEIRNSYFSVPILASYRPSDKWIVQGGLYVAYLYAASFKGTASNGYIRNGGPTGEKIDVDYANFDFSGEQQKFDWGAQVGAEWKFASDFALRGQVAWGLQPLFPSDFTGVSFKMYNIYGTIGVSYMLKQM